MNAYEQAARTLLRETGVTVRRWRSGNSGVADTRSREWEIEAPEPRGPISFGVFAHEVGHQVLHRGAASPRWVQEVEAEEYALAQFDRFSLSGRTRYEFHAARHIGYAFAKAVRRSKRLASLILETYPEWWARAEAADAAALAKPSLSRARRALDEDTA